MRTRLAASSALIALLFILVPLAYAATYTYTGVSGSNDWATSAKWTSSTIPGVGDDAVVNLDFAGADIDSNTGAPASVNTLTFNGYTGGLSSSAAFKIPITVANGATFNFKSLNENTITGNAVFNGDSSNNGGTITGNATFNDTSSAYGTINGNAIFNDTSYFAGTVLGDVTLNTDCYGGVAPTGGAITIDGSGTCGAWLYPSVVGGTLFGSDAIELTTFTFINGASSDGDITGDVTFNDTAFHSQQTITGDVIFNDDSETYGPIVGNVTFNDNSFFDWSASITGNATFFGDVTDLNGTISGTKTRHYTASATTVRDFLAEGMDEIIADGAATVVDISGATYDCTITFTEVNGGQFSPDPGCGGGATAPTITTEAASSLSTTGATLNGTIVATGGADNTVRGFAYGTDALLTSTTATTTDTVGQPFSTGAFTGTLTGLTCNTTYYARAYSTNSAGTGVGSIVSFTTSACPSSGGGNNSGSRSNNRPVTPATPTPVPPLPNPPASCYAFTRTLEKGDNDKGVRKLQQFLNTHGYIVSTSGPGSRGRETSIFGNATEIALARFQEKHGDTLLAPYGLTKGTGALGTKTKERINTEFKTACDASNPPPSVSDPIPWYVDDTPEHPLDPNPDDPAVPPAEEREASASPVLGVGEIEETPPPRSELPTPTTNENPDRPTTDPAPRAPSLLPPPIASLVALMTDLFRDPSSVAAVGLVPLVSATGLLISLGSLIPIALPTVGAPADILLSLKRFWDLLLTALHIRKRRPWGVVYDSVTKRPISPATVRLTDAYGTVLATTQTDLDGRFGFLTGPGAYRIEVVKRDYAFPSTRVLGRDWDEVYTSLYTGGLLTIAADATLRFNIPIDPIGLEWKDFAEQSYRRFHYYSEADRAFRFISAWAFRAGFLSALVIAWTTQTPYEIGILIAYAAVGALRLLGIGPRPYGTLLDKHTREPLAFARLSLSTNSTSEPIRAVSDQLGRYYLLASDGSYELEVASRSSADTYTPIHRATVTIRNGVLNTRLLI